MKLSCIKTLITTLTFCSTAFVYANNMQSSFSEGMNLGKGQNGKSGNVITSFDPSSVSDNYTSNPNEVNLKGNATNLSSQGMSALGKSEVGQAINTSTVNNPKIKISADADFLKSSTDIRENANVISGLKSGKQCVKQVLTKTSLTNHFCEADQEVEATCKTTQNVKWKTKKEYVEEEFVVTNLKLKNSTVLIDGEPPKWVCKGYNRNDNCYGFEFGKGRNINVSGVIPFNIPENGNLISYKVDMDSNQNLPNHLRAYFFNGSHKVNLLNTPSYIGKVSPITSSIVEKEQSLNIGFVADYKKSILLTSGMDNRYIEEGIDFKITLKIAKEVVVPEAYIEQSYSCSANVDDAVKMSEQCTISGGKKSFSKDGKVVELSADCWEKTEKYLISEVSDNECKVYDKNPNCSVAERECILSVGGNCTRFRNTYQCSTTTKTDGYLCGDEFFCSDGKCSDLEGSVNTDFGHAVSQLANLAKAGEDYDYDNQKFAAFTGRPMFCRKSGFGYSDCCKDSGWGNKAGLAKCNSEEQMLGQAKEKKTTIFVGTFCSKKVLGKCIQRKSSYCVFDNKLARITQAQGRSGQLGIGFGDSSNPNCRGLTVEELSSIDFNNMDYSDFYEDLNSASEVPDKNQLMEYMKKSISEQMQQ